MNNLDKDTQEIIEDIKKNPERIFSKLQITYILIILLMFILFFHYTFGKIIMIIISLLFILFRIVFNKVVIFLNEEEF